MNGTHAATARVLRKAAAEIGERGLAKGTCHDPVTGALDVTGAIQFVCGTPVAELTDDLFAAMAVVPQANLPAFCEAWTAVDSTVDGMEEWEDHPATIAGEVVALLERLADTYDRRVIDP